MGFILFRPLWKSMADDTNLCTGYVFDKHFIHNLPAKNVNWGC